MKSKKRRLRFFLDYGNCFWGVDGDGGYVAEDLPLTPQTLEQINQFLQEFHQHYDWGCPPENGWTVADCRRFNSEMRRIFAMVEAELKDECIICLEQDELIEDENLLEELNRRGVEFRDELILIHYGIKANDDKFYM